ncbi:MAG: protein kinase [Deltaproteobacteria bacterium]|nr:protein kinase [Deltaproteobacteria bacterium]
MDGKTQAPIKRGLHSGKKIDGQYQIGALLCQDALGGLYECEDANGEELVIRLFSGGITVAASAHNLPLHPNILIPAQVSTEGKLPRYAVFESFVKSTLREWIKTRVHSTADDLVAVMLQLTNAVHAAHEAGRPLGNLCPETVFVGEDFMGKLEIYVVDADISFAASAMVEKPYMPAKQLEGAKPTVSSDVWSLGTMMYEALYRRKAYAGKNRKELLTQIQTEPLGFSTFKKVPASFISIIKKCLAKDPDAGYVDALSLGSDLLALQKQLGSDISSEKVQKAIQDSIPPAKRISIAPTKKERSARISLAPVMATVRSQPQIAQVPPQKLPAAKRARGNTATEPRSAASKRLSVPPKGAAIPRKSAFPPAAQKSAGINPFAAKISTAPVDDPFADAPRPFTDADELWSDQKRKNSAKPAAAHSATAKKKTLAIGEKGADMGTASKAGHPLTATPTTTDRPPVAPKTTQDHSQIVPRRPQTTVPARPTISIAAPFAASASGNHPPPRDPTPLPPTVSIKPPAVSAAAPGISLPATPPPEPKPIEHSNRRMRKQTVMGIPAAPVAANPPVPQAPAPPPTVPPANVASPVIPAPVMAVQQERDSWSFPPEDEEKTLPARPDALANMLNPDVGNLFDDISMAEFILPVDAAGKRPLPGSPTPQTPMEDTPHPGALSGEPHLKWEHRHIEKSTRRMILLRDAMRHLTETMPNRLAPTIKATFAATVNGVRSLYRRTVASPEFKRRITQQTVQIRTRIVWLGKDRKRLAIIAAAFIMLIAGVSIALSIGGKNEVPVVSQGEQKPSPGAAVVTVPGQQAQQLQDTQHAASRNANAAPLQTGLSNKSTGIARPMSASDEFNDNFKRNDRQPKTPKYKRRESYRKSDTEVDEEEKYRDRTLTRGENFSDESVGVKPVPSTKIKDVTGHKAGAKTNIAKKASPAKEKVAKKKKDGKTGKNKKTRPQKSGWATNPFGG